MKRCLLLAASMAAGVAFFLLSSVAETPAAANAFEYATIRWDGRDNTCVILPNGNVDFVGAKLKAVKRPERVDERAFYMNVVMNSLGRDGFEFAGMSSDQNVIVMKRPLAPKAGTNEWGDKVRPPVAELSDTPPAPGIQKFTPPPPDTLQGYAGGSGHLIQSVMDDGSVIKLEDDSLWKVSPIDEINSALWLPATDIAVIDSDDLSYPYKLVNKDDNEVVNARLLEQ